MAKQQVQTDNAPPPAGPYSQAIRVGDFVFVAGQGPRDPETGGIADTIEGQSKQVLDNIKAILEAAGASMADVVKSTINLDDLARFDDFNKVYETYFPDPKPARTTVGSQLPGVMVSVEVIAYIGG